MGQKTFMIKKGPKKSNFDSVEVCPPAKRISGESLCPTKSTLETAFDVYVMGKDKRVHKARLRIKERKLNRYLYVAYRDGDKVTERYIAQLKGVKA